MLIEKDCVVGIHVRMFDLQKIFWKKPNRRE